MNLTSEMVRFFLKMKLEGVRVFLRSVTIILKRLEIGAILLLDLARNHNSELYRIPDMIRLCCTERLRVHVN